MSRKCFTCVFWREIAPYQPFYGECIEASPKLLARSGDFAAALPWGKFPMTGKEWLCGRHRTVSEEKREDFWRPASERINQDIQKRPEPEDPKK